MKIFNIQFLSNPVEKSSRIKRRGHQFYRLKFRIFTLTILLSQILIAFRTNAQPDSLFSYLDAAAKRNPAILQKYAEFQASLEKIPQAGSLPDPELSTGIFISPMELPGGNQLADIRLMQMFPWFGLLKSAKDEMSLMAKAKFELFRDTRLQVEFEVQQTWYELYKVQSEIKISQRNLEILRSVERLSLVRFKGAGTVGGTSSGNGSVMQGSISPPGVQSSGMNNMGVNQVEERRPESGLPSSAMSSSPSGSGLADLYRLQMETGELENNILLLGNLKQALLTRFNSYLNRTACSPVSLPDTLKESVLNNPTAELSDSLIQLNPMLSMLKYEKKSIEARMQMVSRMGYPMVGLGINYSLINQNPMSSSSMNGKDMLMPMVTLTLPVYRKKYNAMKAETNHAEEAATQGILATSNSLQTEYAEAVQNFLDSKQKIALYTRQFRLASQALHLLTTSFSSAGTGLNDLLRVEQQTLDYGLKQAQAIADNHIAIARIHRLTSGTENK